uniref:ATP synthase protein 8 n=1 Tax=Ricasolia amplissima TaxID=209564 RepID=A0A286QTH6_9LECA|nr:ATPase subunit 8 [Ricasolia amplissima]ASL24573.1 ATPase subunit 8 [Ricasolia amplissima]
MPQLVPFYYTDQENFSFIPVLFMVYLFSKYILPIVVRLFNSRYFINKL